MTNAASLENLSINEHVATASEGVKSALAEMGDPSRHILEHVQEYPALQSLISTTTAKVISFMEIASEVLSVVELQPLLTQASGLARASEGAVKVSELDFPIDIAALDSVTGKLRDAADISEVLDELKAVTDNEQLINAIRAKVGEETLDLNEVVGALEVVNTEGIQINVMNTIFAALDAQEANALSEDQKNGLRHIESELNSIVATIQSNIPRLIDLIKSLLYKVFQ
jgi:hypothetical protein